jgi:tetratricopeptide (TPR) repeat protein
MLGKKHNLFVFLLIISCLAGSAQSKSEKKQAKKHLKEAQVLFYNEDYLNALQVYKKVLAIDKNNETAGVNGAICIFKLRYPVDSALPLAANLAASGEADAKYFLARIRHQQHAFDQALALLSDYNQIDPGNRFVGSPETEYWIAVCENAKKEYASPHRSVIKNMGDEINSSLADYVPVIMPDESALFFTSRRMGSSNNKKDAYGGYYEDIYVSYKYRDKWQRAQNIGAPLNTETNDACVAISPDGQRMILYRTAPDQVTGDLYISKLGAGNQWSNPEKIGNEINSPSIETSACFSNDTSEIYFSSNRPGGYGGKDIYRIKKAPDGHWALPYNLGPNINTPYDDDAPYLHPDGITLYFSSQGHNTMGEFDVFRSVLNQEDNQFSKAENLGYPINDVGNDIFFVLSVDGQRGYYSSMKAETFGGIDIYEIDTRFGDNDLQVKHGTATIGDSPARVKITLTDKENNQVNGNYYSNPSTGKFILVMNPLKSYQLLVEMEGQDPLTMDLMPLASEKTNKELEFKFEKNN